MPYPQFVNGDILDASDMNAVGSWLVRAGSFSAVSTLNIDNVFTADYRNYRMIVEYSTSSTTGISGQFRVGGVATATNYNTQFITAGGTSISTSRSTSLTAFSFAVPTNGAFLSTVEWLFVAPALAQVTNGQLLGGENSAAYTAPLVRIARMNQTAATAFDGIGLTVGATTMTGNYRIYGLRD